MFNLVKDGVAMAVRDNNQLAAFLGSGWTLVEDVKTETAKVEPVVEEVTPEVKVEKKVAAVAKNKGGRPRKATK